MRLARRARGLGPALLCAVVAASGCSLIYDADEFMEAQDPPDAMPPGPDVDFTALELSGVTPTEVVEGAGCLPEVDACADSSRGVPILVTGMSIAPDAVVTLDGAGFAAAEVEASVSSDGRSLAIAPAIPVMPALSATETESIRITVSQGDVSDFVDVTVRGLPEFRASVDAAGGTLDTGDIAPLYSTVHIDAPIRLEGEDPARFFAVALIDIDESVSADGATATGTGGGAGGPGGCDGGAEETPGDCVLGGGRAGGASAGGGGGGHATDGNQGASGGGGPGGMATGSDELVPLADEAGNGGGGGGPGTLGAGGGGGGGGGIVELTSDGALRVGETAFVSADGGGGHGGAGGGCTVLLEHGGGGGGGAGGAILIRARAQLVDDAAATAVSAAAGPRGNDGCNAGGDGADGRIRIDVPSADATPGFAGDALYRGPVLSPQTPAIAPTSPLTIEVFGDAGVTYYVERDGGQRQSVTTDSSRRGSAEVELAPGLNLVCAVVRTDVNISSPEGTNCFSVAYVP